MFTSPKNANHPNPEGQACHNLGKHDHNLGKQACPQPRRASSEAAAQIVPGCEAATRPVQGNLDSKLDGQLTQQHNKNGDAQLGSLDATQGMRKKRTRCKNAGRMLLGTLATDWQRTNKTSAPAPSDEACEVDKITKLVGTVPSHDTRRKAGVRKHRLDAVHG